MFEYLHKTFSQGKPESDEVLAYQEERARSRRFIYNNESVSDLSWDFEQFVTQTESKWSDSEVTAFSPVYLAFDLSLIAFSTILFLYLVYHVLK